jgi:cell division protein ZapA
LAQITVVINNRKYDIACDDGQEKHLTNLAQYVDGKVNDLVASIGQVGDARLLVMTSLLIADELSDLYSEVSSINEGKVDKSNTKLSETDLESITNRIQNIADKLEAI